MTNSIPHTGLGLDLEGCGLGLAWPWDVFTALALALYSVALLTSLILMVVIMHAVYIIRKYLAIA